MMRIFIILLLCFSFTSFNKISAHPHPIPQKDEDKILQQKKIFDKIKKNVEIKTDWPKDCESFIEKPFIDISENKEFLYCGILTAKSITDLIDFTKTEPTIKKIRIKSNGGYHLGAFYIGRQFNDNGFFLIIDGICLSACVDLSLAFNNVVITKNTIFAADYNFISSVNYLIEAAIAKNILEQIENKKHFKNIFANSFWYLITSTSSKPIRHTIFQKIMAPMEIECMGDIKDNDLVLVDFNITFKSRYDLWVVPIEFINYLRTNFGLNTIDSTSNYQQKTTTFLNEYSEKYKIRTVTYDEIFEIYERDKNKTPQFCSVE